MNPPAPAVRRASPEGAGRTARPRVKWVRLACSLAGRAALATLAGLLVWSQLPAVLPGWRTSVILTGSMGPQIRPGDVVLFAQRPAHTIKAGAVVLFPHPTRPDRLLSHRVHEVRRDGKIITAGDANARPDATPLDPRDVLGQGRLRVPWIGLPVVWWQRGERGGDPDEPGDAPERPDQPDQPERRGRQARRSRRWRPRRAGPPGSGRPWRAPSP
ncbi:signal peptidase I [Nonomuraea lactucae]|uniref:signal peptidase I n=1 Tax=Nonomuraea lactucae TaxID=2249762 RepID=UPI000DE3A57E|nr:signal peptidase I [Nonomuraea lactucae]